MLNAPTISGTVGPSHTSWPTTQVDTAHSTTSAPATVYVLQHTIWTATHAGSRLPFGQPECDALAILVDTPQTRMNTGSNAPVHLVVIVSRVASTATTGVGCYSIVRRTALLAKHFDVVGADAAPYPLFGVVLFVVGRS